MENDSDGIEVIDVLSFRGKEVKAANGEKIGKIDAIFLHYKTRGLQSIRVSKGIFQVDYYIPAEYIERFTHEGAVLNITPVKEFLGYEVYDSSGKKVGKVKEIKIKGRNRIECVIIDRGIINQDLTIDREEIAGIGRNVMLNIEVA